MQGLPFVLLFTALTFLSWGAYGPLLRHGTDAMGHDGLKAFVGVGLAYFVIAVIVPFWILRKKGEKGRWTFVGTTYSIVAGSVGALGALGIILALVFKGNPVYVMPLVFGFAPIVNTLVTAWMGGTLNKIRPIFVCGIVAAALGAGGVLTFKPPAKPAAALASTHATGTAQEPASEPADSDTGTSQPEPTPAPAPDPSAQQPSTPEPSTPDAAAVNRAGQQTSKPASAPADKALPSASNSAPAASTVPLTTTAPAEIKLAAQPDNATAPAPDALVEAIRFAELPGDGLPPTPQPSQEVAADQAASSTPTAPSARVAAAPSGPPASDLPPPVANPESGIEQQPVPAVAPAAQPADDTALPPPVPNPESPVSHRFDTNDDRVRPGGNAEPSQILYVSTNLTAPITTRLDTAAADEASQTAAINAASDAGPAAPSKTAAAPNIGMIALSILIAALCWGSYGPMLHQGQMRMGGSRLRPFACVGIAYFIIAVAVPLILLYTTPTVSHGSWTAPGLFWSVVAGAAGAVGALGIILAFNSGGKPIYVMPLVFGFAPVINTFISLTEAGTWAAVRPMFWISLAVVIAGAITVLTTAPKAHHGPVPVPAK